jgi:hypothetical protein
MCNYVRIQVWTAHTRMHGYDRIDDDYRSLNGDIIVITFENEFIDCALDEETVLIGVRCEGYIQYFIRKLPFDI